MNQNLLTKARIFEKSHKEDVDPFRPSIHFSPMVGWCNDPNGFSIYKNEYHLFYQYYPYDIIWGTMHWGHAKTKDFITWEYLPAALAPDKSIDEEGCYSGSAVELEDGRQLLIYTGCHDRDASTDTIMQHQCIAIGNGMDYIKISDNPAILPDTLPDGHSIHDFRDPKVWKEDGVYYLVLTNRIADESSVILLYESDDGFRWKYVAELDGSNNIYGKMWECPDFFSLDDRQLLIISPQEMQSDGKEFFAGYSNIVIIGDYDKETHSFSRESVRTIDYGTDFYAPQTLLTPDGRRIMIAWMQNWSSADYKGITGQHFFGEMTLPRELSIRNGRLCQAPVRELANYYASSINYSSINIKETPSLEGIGGSCYDMTVTLYIDKNESDFAITLRDDGTHKFILSYDARQGAFIGDRSHTDIAVDQVNVRRFFAKAVDGILKLRFIVDRYSIEIFVNDGEQTASFILNTPGSGITFSSENDMMMDVEFHEIIKR